MKAVSGAKGEWAFRRWAGRAWINSMLWLTILILSLLAVINYRLSGKQMLSPPVVFCAIWAFDLLLIALTGGLFYPMLPQTLFIFVCGAFAFSLGGWIANAIPRSTRSTARPPGETPQKSITILVWLVVVGFPFFCRWLFGLVAARGGGSALAFLALARMSMMEAMGKSLAFTLFGSLAEASIVIALIAYYERENHSKRAFMAILVSLAMGVLMGQKIGPLSLLTGILYLDWIKTRHLRWKFVALILLVFIALTATIEFYVHVGGDSLREKAVPIVEDFALYASGGIVAFDRGVRDPSVAPRGNQLNDLYLHLLKRLGLMKNYVEIPELGDYVAIGPNGFRDNVYTIYGSYLDAGYSGAVLVTGLLGLLVGLVYRSAGMGNKTSIVIYAILFHAIIFSPFIDYFLALYSLLRAWFLLWLVYSFPARWAQFMAFSRRSVRAELVRSE